MSTRQANTKSQTIDVLIIGAGIGGTSLACFLLLDQLKRSSGTSWRITILERSPAVRGHGQNIDIRGPGKDLLGRLGINGEIRAATTGEEGVKFVDSAGSLWAKFAVDKTGKVETGTGEIEILRGRLAEILFHRCQALGNEVERNGAPGVEFIFGDSLEEIQQGQSEAKVDRSADGKVHVLFKKSKTWRAFDIVVGADGLQSNTRALAWNTEYRQYQESRETVPLSNESPSSAGGSMRHRHPHKAAREDATTETSTQHRDNNEKIHYIMPSTPRDRSKSSTDPYLRPLDVYAAFYSVPATLLSEAPTKSSREADEDFNDDWRRWYHAPGRKSVMVRPSHDKSRLTVLMLVIDLKQQDPRLPTVTTVTDDRKVAVAKQKQLMGEYFADAGWVCERLVEGMNASDDFYYDLVAQVNMERWSKGQVCLLGDAAHCASPFSGMGTTLALVGAYNLAGALNKHLIANSSSEMALDAGNTSSSLPIAALEIALSEYETATRPIVTKAQKLPPGMPYAVHPETEWGVWVMHCIVGFVSWFGLNKLAFSLAARRTGRSKEEILPEW